MSAGPDDPTLLSVAASISAGEPVAWEQLARDTSGAPDEGMLRELRVLEDIARFHRTDDDRDEASPVRTWSHFTIVEQVGAGVFGAVYRATDEKLQCEVALKLRLASVHDGGDVTRALKEARLLARVRHANVVQVHGADYLEGRVGIWMEFVKGQTLEDLLVTNGPFGAREAALVGLDLCRALAAVHRAGLIHGDVKAHNVMREEGGRTVLMDFGSGKEIETDPSGSPVPLGDLAGTPLYLAPEVFKGEPRTRATDLYALGVLLYHLVTQGYPVNGATAAEVTQAHGRGERARLRDARPDLPDTFVEIVERALSAPEARWSTAGALEAELGRFLGARAEVREKRRTKGGTVFAFAMAAVVVASGAGYWLAGPGRSTPSRDLAGANHTGSSGVVSPKSDGEASRQPPAPAIPPGAYTIDAAVYREEQNGSELKLQPNDSVRPGDKLFLEVRSSAPAHVYVINEDDRGGSLLLFPLPGQEVTNPLPAGSPVRLPGRRGEDMVYWQVSNVGHREHFLIFASPEPLTAFETMFAALPQPRFDAPVNSAPLTRQALGELRSIGGLVAEPPRRARAVLSSQFTTELGPTAETAKGLWVRQITFDNSSR
jgi:eukaryotic-like serine/threonine-protein kinase